MTSNPLDQQYPIVVRPDKCTDGSFCWVAEHPDLPGCGAHGDTIAEAKKLLDGARRAYLQELLNQARSLPVVVSNSPREWQIGRPMTDRVMT